MLLPRVLGRQDFRPVFSRTDKSIECNGQAITPDASGYNGEVQFSLREYRPDDFDALWRIDQQCFAPGIAYSQRELSSYIRRRGSFTIVAEQSDGVSFPIAGFIVAEANRRTGHVISIDVLPANRRSGVGSRLLLAAEDRLRSHQCQTIFLETAVDNSSALAFYKRHKYAVLRVYPRYYSNGVDAFVMGKNLVSTQEALTQTG
jgi:[ribosomal protein S18]-alanine N-acetyltransferase